MYQEFKKDTETHWFIQHGSTEENDFYHITVDKEYMPNVINSLRKESKCDTNLISDGYHTFGELYEHRIALFIALCETMKCLDNYRHRQKSQIHFPVWRSQYTSGGVGEAGWFILGLGMDKGKQISYHLPMSKWDECGFAETLDRAPEWDGHTSQDVLERLKKL